MWVVLGHEHKIIISTTARERGRVGLFWKKKERYGRWVTLAFSIFEYESEGRQQKAL